MTIQRSLAALAAITLGAAAVACSGGVENNGTGGTGGTGGSSSSTTSTGDATSSSVSTTTSSSTTSSTTSTSTSSSSSSGTGGSSACAPSGDTVLAVSKIFYGDTDFNGVKSSTAWKGFGFNLDNDVSTAASVGLCKPSNNASPNTVYPDGDNGIDNSFGKNILPIFLGLISNFSAQANQSIASGSFTLLVKLDGLGAAADQSPITAKLYAGAPAPPPKFDGSDCWPVSPDALSNPADAESAKVVFPSSTLAANHWDSGSLGTIPIMANASGFNISLTIHNARITLDLDPTHQSAPTGMIGGVLDTEELVATVQQIAAQFDQSFCDPNSPTLQSILTQIRQASDILKDGTQDPNATCDGISIGLGLNATLVQFGAIGPQPPPPVDPCP